jgi:hypothetical protein
MLPRRLQDLRGRIGPPFQSMRDVRSRGQAWGRYSRIEKRRFETCSHLRSIDSLWLISSAGFSVGTGFAAGGMAETSKTGVSFQG